jgi:hypothetical protein
MKDEALRALTEEAKQAVMKATDFLATAVKKQQEDLQVRVAFSNATKIHARYTIHN